MGRRKRDAGENASALAARLAARIHEQPAGWHHVREPCALLDAELPPQLAAIYREFDGADLFHEAIVLWPSARARKRTDAPGQVPNFLIGEIAGDDLVVDRRDRVFRLESDTGEWLPEGSALGRWLLGAVEAEAMLYDEEGEFAEDAFEDSGEVSLEVGLRMHRCVLARDKNAPAPRWRLARLQVIAGALDEARGHLEQVVEHTPDFPWAWYDLARISEALGERDGALEEYLQAAECRPGYEHEAFFLACAARVARALGDEDRRRLLAERATALAGDLARAQRDGAQSLLDHGLDDPSDAAAALERAELAVALAPRDLSALDLLARVKSRLPAR